MRNVEKEKEKKSKKVSKKNGLLAVVWDYIGVHGQAFSYISCLDWHIFF